MARTQVSRHVAAPAEAVYAALLDPDSLARWRVPDDMTATVHELDPVVGGRIRVTLRYRDAARAGKTRTGSDTYHGEFLRLVPGREVVETAEFETGDSSMRGVMTLTTTIRPSGDGCEVTFTHEGLPDAVPIEQNELGTRMALDKLAAHVERGPQNTGEVSGTPGR